VDPLLRLTLRQGTVYYMPDRGLSSPEPHYFIVVNRNPVGENLLLMAVTTSQVERAERRIERPQMPEETLVHVSPEEYTEFTKPSCVNCNQLFTRTVAEFQAQKRSGNVVDKLDLPAPVLERILKGILASPQVSDEDKAKV